MWLSFLSSLSAGGWQPSLLHQATMTLSNAEVETLWIEAWNQVYEITDESDAYPSVLPDGSNVSVDKCLGC